MNNKHHTVHGIGLDNETRCTHYHTPVDVIAIKFKCCNKFYACIHCHNESEDHAPVPWSKSEFDEHDKTEPEIYCIPTRFFNYHLPPIKNGNYYLTTSFNSSICFIVVVVEPEAKYHNFGSSS